MSWYLPVILRMFPGVVQIKRWLDHDYTYIDVLLKPKLLKHAHLCGKKNIS